MGFAATLNAILENLPQDRQTMLFSATQTKSVKDLARLSLDAPEYIAVHAEAAMPTPVKLQQACKTLAFLFCPALMGSVLLCPHTPCLALHLDIALFRCQMSQF